MRSGSRPAHGKARGALPYAALALAIRMAPCAAFALAGCENEPPHTVLNYAENAKRAYENAMKTFNAHNWIESQALMREVKRKYSYSKYARLAELRIADADFEQEKYAEATREFKDFIHAHRSDAEEIEYARSKIAEATFAEIPESFFLPASEERDQAAVVDAYKEMKSFIADYPEGKQTAHVREMLATITARLVRHELYVARFYLNKNNYDAAVARIQFALRNYGTAISGPHGADPTAGLEAEALLLLGTTYLQMHEWPGARQAFEAIVRNYETSPLAEQARNYLRKMNESGT
jgi:outer membrane protein assembly factor BamD